MKRFVPLVAALVFSAGAAASARTIQLDDLKSLTGVSEATIDPSGTQIAFIVSRPDYKHDRNVREIDLYDIKSKSIRPLVIERKGIGALAWSPDGGRLGFLAASGDDSDATEQVYELDMRGGDAMRVTGAPRDVQQFAWRPDGNAIAYVMADEGKNKEALKHHVRAFVVGDQSFLEEEAPTPSHLWLATPQAAGKEWKSERLTSGDWSVPPAAPPSSPSSPISWSPDGRYIVFAKMSSD